MKAILIRHGEPNYENVHKWGRVGLGFEFGELTELGEEQAYERSKDKNLHDADLIVSSPYTRALQTAAIISKETGINLKVESELHEWFPDIDFIYNYEVFDASSEYFSVGGIRPKNSKFRYEEYETIKKRVRKVLEKYKEYNKVIFVCHGLVMNSQTNFEDRIEHCGVREVLI